MKNEQTIFTDIYSTNKWKGSESLSGPGSSLHTTAKLRAELPGVLRALEVRTFVDAPCGDMNWMRQLDYEFERFNGFDVVPEVIESVRKRDWPTHFHFGVANITKDVLPEADALFCRDCLVHLPYSNIFEFFELLQSTRFRYLLTTTFPDKANKDSGVGGWRPLNLQAPPFDWPAPLMIIAERLRLPTDPYYDKSIGVWRLESLDTVLR